MPLQRGNLLNTRRIILHTIYYIFESYIYREAHKKIKDLKEEYSILWSGHS